MQEIPKRKAVVTTVLVPLAVTLGMVISSSDLVAQASHAYTGVTQAVFDSCIKPKAQNRAITKAALGKVPGWAEYDAGNEGNVQLKADAWFAPDNPAKLKFVYEPEKNMLTYTIEPDSKDIRVTEKQIWKGFDGTMIKCKGNAN